jgi:hypothetical protein
VCEHVGQRKRVRDECEGGVKRAQRELDESVASEESEKNAEGSVESTRCYSARGLGRGWHVVCGRGHERREQGGVEIEGRRA